MRRSARPKWTPFARQAHTFLDLLQISFSQSYPADGHAALHPQQRHRASRACKRNVLLAWSLTTTDLFPHTLGPHSCCVHLVVSRDAGVLSSAGRNRPPCWAHPAYPLDGPECVLPLLHGVQSSPWLTTDGLAVHQVSRLTPLALSRPSRALRHILRTMSVTSTSVSSLKATFLGCMNDRGLLILTLGEPLISCAQVMRSSPSARTTVLCAIAAYSRWTTTVVCHPCIFAWSSLC